MLRNQNQNAMVIDEDTPNPDYENYQKEAQEEELTAEFANLAKELQNLRIDDPFLDYNVGKMRQQLKKNQKSRQREQENQELFLRKTFFLPQIELTTNMILALLQHAIVFTQQKNDATFYVPHIQAINEYFSSYGVTLSDFMRCYQQNQDPKQILVFSSHNPLKNMNYAQACKHICLVAQQRQLSFEKLFKTYGLIQNAYKANPKIRPTENPLRNLLAQFKANELFLQDEMGLLSLKLGFRGSAGDVLLLQEAKDFCFKNPKDLLKAQYSNIMSFPELRFTAFYCSWVLYALVQVSSYIEYGNDPPQRLPFGRAVLPKYYLNIMLHFLDPTDELGLRYPDILTKGSISAGLSGINHDFAHQTLTKSLTQFEQAKSMPNDPLGINLAGYLMKQGIRQPDMEFMIDGLGAVLKNTDFYGRYSGLNQDGIAAIFQEILISMARLVGVQRQIIDRSTKMNFDMFSIRKELGKLSHCPDEALPQIFDINTPKIRQIAKAIVEEKYQRHDQALLYCCIFQMEEGKQMVQVNDEYTLSLHDPGLAEIVQNIKIIPKQLHILQYLSHIAVCQASEDYVSLWWWGKLVGAGVTFKMLGLSQYNFDTFCQFQKYSKKGCPDNYTPAQVLILAKDGFKVIAKYKLSSLGTIRETDEEIGPIRSIAQAMALKFSQKRDMSAGGDLSTCAGTQLAKKTPQKPINSRMFTPDLRSIQKRKFTGSKTNPLKPPNHISPPNTNQGGTQQNNNQPQGQRIGQPLTQTQTQPQAQPQAQPQGQPQGQPQAQTQAQTQAQPQGQQQNQQRNTTNNQPIANRTRSNSAAKKRLTWGNQGNTKGGSAGKNLNNSKNQQTKNPPISTFNLHQINPYIAKFNTGSGVLHVVANIELISLADWQNGAFNSDFWQDNFLLTPQDLCRFLSINEGNRFTSCVKQNMGKFKHGWDHRRIKSSVQSHNRQATSQLLDGNKKSLAPWLLQFMVMATSWHLNAVDQKPSDISKNVAEFFTLYTVNYSLKSTTLLCKIANAFVQELYDQTLIYSVDTANLASLVGSSVVYGLTYERNIEAKLEYLK